MGADLIRYDLLVQDALRSVVRRVLSDAARDGLRGDHHFNISFKTHAPGVALPASIKQRYPEEMAIILQHEFWDLAVGADHFEVSLNFSRKPERLTIPFDAITGFSDPSVPFGFKLEPRVAEAPADAAPPPPVPAPKASAKATPKSEPKPKLVEAAKGTDKPADGEAAKVVSIDAFRKK
ncbi:MAG: hypothetical protein KGM15_00740 [Pseudomonadota bacterium]|nr:hypothetical protein [Pseudomonadota bacterium]